MTYSSDPSTIGKPKYERAELDFYPTPENVTWAIQPYLPTDKMFWEPACGDGAIEEILTNLNWTYGSDIKDYGVPRPFEFESHDFLTDPIPEMYKEDPPPFAEGGVCIVTNPPYDKAHEFVQRFFDIPEVTQAFFLLRHDWDASQKSYPLVSSPWFKTKYVLKSRPRWIPGTKVAPRFNYAWYEWDKTNTTGNRTIYGVHA